MGAASEEDKRDRGMPPLHRRRRGPLRPIPQVRQAPELPAAGQREHPGGLHLHSHGVSAEEIAAAPRAPDRK